MTNNLSRHSDPLTSSLGADHVKPKLGTLQAVFVERVAYWRDTFGTWPTANEVGQGQESIRKRGRECVRLGYLVVGGRRRCSKTGRPANTYEIRGAADRTYKQD